MRCDHRNEEPDLSEGSVAADRADGCFVQICVSWRGQRSPLFLVPEEEQQVRMDQGVRRGVPQAE